MSGIVVGAFYAAAVVGPRGVESGCEADKQEGRCQASAGSPVGPSVLDVYRRRRIEKEE